MEEVGSSRKVSLSEQVVPSRRVLGSRHQGGFSIVPSRRVPLSWVQGLAIQAGVVEVDSVSVSASQAGQVWIRSVPSKVRSGIAPSPTSRPGEGPLHTWIRCVPCRYVWSVR